MLYLLDANVLIDANRDYYPLGRVPQFWDWMQHAAAAGKLKVPAEIYEEITAGSGDLVDWLKQREIKRDLVFNENAEPALVDRVVSTGYASDLSDLELNKVGRDPFLIAYALAKPNLSRNKNRKPLFFLVRDTNRLVGFQAVDAKGETSKPSRVARRFSEATLR